MRPAAAIDADIAATEAKLRALHAERRGSMRARSDLVVADFDTGMSIGEVAEVHTLTYSAAQGILFRAGRTDKGRTAIKRQLATVGAEARA